jgi:2C-methyl-D-erythritol 2,4-cyclodiphosphate synthase
MLNKNVVVDKAVYVLVGSDGNVLKHALSNAVELCYSREEARWHKKNLKGWDNVDSTIVKGRLVFEPVKGVR